MDEKNGGFVETYENVKIASGLRFIALSGVIPLFTGCWESKSANTAARNVIMQEQQRVFNDTTQEINGFPVELRVPKVGVRGVVFLLPGWGFFRTKWCTETNFCEKALKEGYLLVLPEMGKSVYQTDNYPETRKDWRIYPTRTWFNSELIPHLKAQGILDTENVFVLGLSTGARGAVLLALDNPELFKGVAALSGDYDQTLMPDDNLMKGVYGHFEEFPDRWKGSDNPAMRAKEWKTPLFLGHGKADKVVPVEQTEVLYNRIIHNNPEVPVILELSDAGHDFQYWSSMEDKILDFFKAQNP